MPTAVIRLVIAPCAEDDDDDANNDFDNDA
jgi:hypothetical protein